jgi:hypothetical protein
MRWLQTIILYSLAMMFPKSSKITKSIHLVSTTSTYMHVVPLDLTCVEPQHMTTGASTLVIIELSVKYSKEGIETLCLLKIRNKWLKSSEYTVK